MSNIRQVPCQRLRGAGGDGGAMRVERMVRHHAHARAARQRLALQGIDAEADELHGADAIAVELAAVEERRGDAGAVEVEMQMAIETDQVAQLHVAPLGLGELEHERGGELVARRQKIAVRLDLVRDLRLLGDALGAQHLLDLILHRLAILEGDGGVGAELDAADGARADGARANPVALPLVVAEVEDLGARNLIPAALEHGRHPSVSSPFWNRPACDFSARASVSNQSAISAKPSSRAVLAMPGYMSVYSCVSPWMAALRFSWVSPMGRPVAGSPTLRR